MSARAQSTMEFVVLAGVMLLVFTGMFILIQDNIFEAQQKNMYGSMDELGNLVRTELQLAQSVRGTYIRDFYLPYHISDYNYSISLQNKKDITISVPGIDYVVFVDENISGTLQKGWNRILKRDGNITLNFLCTEGAGSDDDECGTISCSGWYEKTGDEGARDIDIQSCYAHQDIAENRCEGFDDCKDSNTEDCEGQELLAAAEYECGECRYIADGDCEGATQGECTLYDAGTYCGANTVCNSTGSCVDACNNDGTCEDWENFQNCPSDCPEPASQAVIMNNEGTVIASFSEQGDIILVGECSQSTSCVPPADSFVITDNNGEAVAYIDNSGNLCIEAGDCTGNDDCSTPGSSSFVLKNETSIIVYIDDSGALCLEGEMYSNT